ncbi:MAG: hypothetical protein ACJAQ1_000285 [Flavobacterium sp.]|jgi:hypothetical protein
MNKLPLILLLLLSITCFSQKKDKIKGSKIVTTETRKIENFSGLEVADNIEVVLKKGLNCGLEIEADDNLHEAIDITLSGSTLKLSTTKNITSAKKLTINLTYKEDFNNINLLDESSVISLTDFELTQITINATNSSKLFLNAKVENFKLLMDEKAKGELNLKSQNATITLSKNSELKALIASVDLTFDMYQKTDAIIEGDVDNLKLRLDNNADFVGNNLTTKNAEVLAESYSKASIQIKNNATIEALGKSELEIYGDGAINLKRFTDNAILKKKTIK